MCIDSNPLKFWYDDNFNVLLCFLYVSKWSYTSQDNVKFAFISSLSKNNYLESLIYRHFSSLKVIKRHKSRTIRPINNPLQRVQGGIERKRSSSKRNSSNLCIFWL